MSARRLFPPGGLHGAYVLFLLVTSVVRADLQIGVDIAMKIRVELGHFVHPRVTTTSCFRTRRYATDSTFGRKLLA